MAANHKYSGARIKIDTASGAVTSGVAVVQEGFFGIALATVITNQPFMLAIQGVWNIPVPAATVKSDLLYVPSSTGGALLTESTAPVLARASSNVSAPVVVAITDRDAAGNADVMILPRAAGRAATQV